MSVVAWIFVIYGIIALISSRWILGITLYGQGEYQYKRAIEKGELYWKDFWIGAIGAALWPLVLTCILSESDKAKNVASVIRPLFLYKPKGFSKLEKEYKEEQEKKEEEKLLSEDPLEEALNG